MKELNKRELMKVEGGFWGLVIFGLFVTFSALIIYEALKEKEPEYEELKLVPKKDK